MNATMACVQAQTYPNIVHVVFDNGSNDATPRIIESFKGLKVPVIHVCGDPALPQLASWNRTASLVPPEAKYQLWLCADDLVRSDAIEKMTALAERDPAIHLVSAIDVFGGQVRRTNLPLHRQVFDGEAVVRMVVRRQLGWFPWHCFFARRSPEDENCDYFPQSRTGLDADAVCKILLRGKLGYIHAPLIYTRWSADTVTAIALRQSDPRFVLGHLERLSKFGSAVLEPDELNRLRKALTRLVLRHQVAWAAKGAFRAAKKSSEGLASFGIGPSPLDYIHACAEWPLYSYQKSRSAKQVAEKLAWITEAEFNSEFHQVN